MSDHSPVASATQGTSAGTRPPKSTNHPWVKLPLQLLQDMLTPPRLGGWQGSEARVWAQLQYAQFSGRALTNKGIADALGLRRATVRKYRNSLIDRGAISEQGSPAYPDSGHQLGFAWLDYDPPQATTLRVGTIRQSDRSDGEEAIRQADRSEGEAIRQADRSEVDGSDENADRSAIRHADRGSIRQSSRDPSALDRRIKDGSTRGPEPSWAVHFAARLSIELRRSRLGSSEWTDPAGLVAWVLESETIARAAGVESRDRLWEYWTAQITGACRDRRNVTAPGKLWASEVPFLAWLELHRARFKREADWAAQEQAEIDALAPASSASSASSAPASSAPADDAQGDESEIDRRQLSIDFFLSDIEPPAAAE